MNWPRVAILHYSAPPIVGGVESVIQSHARLMSEAGIPTVIVAGKGSKGGLPDQSEFIQIPEMDTQHPGILEINRELEQGRVPTKFDEVVTSLEKSLTSALQKVDLIIVHNIFTKHFNLPLTAALCRMLDKGTIKRCIAWCHDFTWTSPHSREKVHRGYPWDLLRSKRSETIYVTISKSRQRELAGLFNCAEDQIRVIYNGVHADELLAIPEAGMALIDRLGLWESDLNLIMPVRVTQAKNIELSIRLVASLKKQGVRTKLVVSGPPDPHDQDNVNYFQSLLDLRREMDVEQEMRFVYESGPEAGQPFVIDMQLVSALLRVSDVLFMPSHREGFGMPVLEAGLAGIPVFCARNIPAAREIGGPDITIFSPDAEPEQVADLILAWTKNNQVYNLRKRTRQNFTWNSIFRREILPLLTS